MLSCNMSSTNFYKNDQLYKVFQLEFYENKLPLADATELSYRRIIIN